MKRRNRFVSNEAFTEEKLPHTRAQVFWTSLKNRYFFIVKVGLLLTLFCLPLFLWSIFMRLQIDGNAANLLDDGSNIAQILSQSLQLSNLKNAVNIILFGVAGIGFGGAIHCFQKLVWNQIVLVSDFFEGMKKNIIKYFVFGVIVGISYFLFQFIIYAVPLTSLSYFLRVLLYGLGTIQLTLIIIFVFYLYLQNEYYYLSVINLISNAFKFVFKSFISIIAFIFIIFLPYSLVLLHIVPAYFGAVVLFFFLAPVGLILLILHIDFQFDKNINKTQYPEIFDRGIYRLN